MDIAQTLTYGGEVEDQLSQKLIVARFKNFAKEKFFDSIKYDVNYLDFVKTVARHSSIKFPTPLNEFFIRMDTAPFFWISDSKIIIKAEEELKEKVSGSYSITANYLEIKKFYTKWIIQKNEKEKQYFALSAINLIERSTDSKNFIKHLIHASILIFDKRIHSTERALEKLSIAHDILDNNNFDDNVKNEFFYLINLYGGFAHFQEGNLEEANNKFADAQIFKHHSVSAKFYNALVEKMLNNHDACLDLLADIIDYDKLLFDFAIKHNGLSLFEFLLNNAVIFNIFAEVRFSDLLPKLDVILNSVYISDDSFWPKTYDKILKVNDMEIQDFIDESVHMQLEFIKKFIDRYRDNRNLIVAATPDLLNTKFKTIIESIVSKIEHHYLGKIKVELEFYENEIVENQDAKKFLVSEKDEILSKFKKKLKETISNIEEGVNEQINLIEYTIENIDTSPKFNPSKAFHNAMVYNVIISTAIFIIGGFSSGFIDGFQAADSSSEVFMGTMVNGAKWGGIIFFLGLLVSMITAASTVWERTTERQRLVKDINNLKNQKDRTLTQIQKENDTKMRAFEENFKERLKDNEKNHLSLIDAKNEKAKELKDSANDQISSFVDDLNELLT